MLLNISSSLMFYMQKPRRSVFLSAGTRGRGRSCRLLPEPAGVQNTGNFVNILLFCINIFAKFPQAQDMRLHLCPQEL